MSFKAYVMKIESPNQAKILHDYLTKMGGVGWFNYALRVNKKTANFEKNDVVAAITVDRGDLSESFVDETKVCNQKEVPVYAMLKSLRVDKKGKIEGMTIDPKISLESLSKAVARGVI